LNEDPAWRAEAMHRWASVALARPVTVHYRRLHAVLFAVIMLFFTGISALAVVANGLTGVSILVLGLNGVILLTISYFQGRARRRAAGLFDLSGVTRADRRRFDWSEFKGVDYFMAIKPRSGKEYLWRVELAFTGGEVWIIPQRVTNLDEVINLFASLPGAHQKRRA
jgi:hypothetical protein